MLQARPPAVASGRANRARPLTRTALTWGWHVSGDGADVAAAARNVRPVDGLHPVWLRRVSRMATMAGRWNGRSGRDSQKACPARRTVATLVGARPAVPPAHRGHIVA